MTATPSQSLFDFWNPLLPSPYPAQDTEFLRQLDFLPGLRELLMLRQVHALEHATVWILGQMLPTDGLSSERLDAELLGGMSTDQGFYLYGQVPTVDVRRAVHVALRRITQGEWGLAVHPRCGTNVSVGMLLMAGLALGSHLLLPRSPIEQLLGLGLAATTAAQLAPDLGIAAQRYVTTAIPFNLEIEQVSAVADYAGRPAHFVRVNWINRQ